MRCAVRIFFNCADGADDRDSDDLRRPVVRRNKRSAVLHRCHTAQRSSSQYNSRDRWIAEAINRILGYGVTISEHRPFMVGVDHCGDNREYRADGTLGAMAVSDRPSGDVLCVD
jgi:hypothetical protein